MALECVDTSQLGAFSLSLSCASPVFFDNMHNIAFKSRTRPEQRQRKIAPKHSCPHTLTPRSIYLASASQRRYNSGNADWQVCRRGGAAFATHRRPVAPSARNLGHASITRSVFGKSALCLTFSAPFFRWLERSMISPKGTATSHRIYGYIHRYLYSFALVTH